MKPIFSFVLMLAMGILLSGCLQRQGKMNGAYVSVIGGETQKMPAYISWELGKTEGSASLSIYDAEGHKTSYTFRFLTADVETTQHKNGATEYKVKTHPLENKNLDAELIMVVNPIVSQTASVSAKGFKVIVEDHRYEEIKPIVNLYKEIEPKDGDTVSPRKEVVNVGSFSGQYEQLAQN